jgi:hypothetical protein
VCPIERAVPALPAVGLGGIHREFGRRVHGASRVTKTMRRTDGCMNCGEVREIAAHGLCFACYRRQERAVDRQFANVDRHNPGVRREHKKLFRGFTSLMVGLSDLGVPNDEVLIIRRIIEPYLEPIAKFLALASEQDKVEGAVNSEQKSSDVFTVHARVLSSVDATEEKP